MDIFQRQIHSLPNAHIKKSKFKEASEPIRVLAHLTFKISKNCCGDNLMIKSLVEAAIAQIVATVALSVCIGIGAVAAAYSLFHLLMLAMPSWVASGLISLTFLIVAAWPPLHLLLHYFLRGSKAYCWDLSFAHICYSPFQEPSLNKIISNF